ncbi:2765_t:CDS:1, partial [Dentiscutata heterogama]
LTISQIQSIIKNITSVEPLKRTPDYNHATSVMIITIRVIELTHL